MSTNKRRDLICKYNFLSHKLCRKKSKVELSLIECVYVCVASTPCHTHTEKIESFVNLLIFLSKKYIERKRAVKWHVIKILKLFLACTFIKKEREKLRTLKNDDRILFMPEISHYCQFKCNPHSIKVSICMDMESLNGSNFFESTNLLCYAAVCVF